MEILDRLYINAYFKNTDCLDFEGSYYKLRLKGDNLEVSTDDEYLPEKGVLTYSEKLDSEDGLASYLVYPNSLFVRLRDNTVMEAYDGEFWLTIYNLPTPYLRVKHFIKENCESVN